MEDTISEYSESLRELEDLLAEECLALRSLDRSVIDATTARKLALCERIDQLRSRVPIRESDRVSLERIRKAALLNQMLVVHARDTVRGLIALATGVRVSGYPSPNACARDGIRIDLRG